MQNDSIRREYDYIVVGSGAGGAPVAANLARAGYRVLVLEAGGRHAGKIETEVPVLHGKSTEEEDIRWDYWINHYTEEDRQKRDPKYHPNEDDLKDPERKAYYKADKNRRGVLYPRCSAVGGCTVHNAMICIYPHNNDWDRIADALKDESWRGNRMRRYYERLERCQYGVRNTLWSILRGFFMLLCLPFNPGRRGFDGWLATSRVDASLLSRDKQLKRIVAEAVEQTVEETPGNAFSRFFRFFKRVSRGLDPNAWSTIRNREEGVAITPVNVDTRSGRRSSPRELLLEVERENPDKLIIKTDVLVTRVLFKGNRAIGVEFVEGANQYRAHTRSPDHDRNGTKPKDIPRRRAWVTREVILSAGAFNTPQILMHSGIGPKEELEWAGYDPNLPPGSGDERAPVAILNGVGKNLQDRYEVGVVTDMNSDFVLSEGARYEPDEGDPHFREWKTQGTGVYATNGSVVAVVKRSKQSRPDPDLYIFGVAGDFQGYEPGYSRKALEQRDRFTWVVLKGHTQGRAGCVTLRKGSSPPKSPRECEFRNTPEINFRYFDDDPDHPGWEEDLDSVVEGVKFVRRINNDEQMKELIQQEVAPGPNVQSDEQLRQFIKDHAWGHHCSCTCRMGPSDDPAAVLDGDFRVQGVRNLRVVDASVFPTIPGLFIVSAIYMVAEKASDAILKDSTRPNIIQGPLAAALSDEIVEPDEEKTIQRIIGLLRQKLADDYRNTRSLRDTHPKSNGLVRARFIIESTLQEKYRIGLFREPGRVFEALLRYSNAAPEITPDYVGDFRGIAVKLFGITEQEFGPKFLDDERDTHDFLFIAHDRFFAADPRDFADFFDTLVNGRFARWFGIRGRRLDVVFGYILKGLRFRQAKALLQGRGTFGSPLEITWFGVSPYRFGPDHVVKYRIQPSTTERTPIPAQPSDDYLRDTMTRQLKAGDYDLDFQIQFRTHPDLMPIEDTSVPWDETLSPFVKIATLRVLQQDFNGEVRREYDENLSYNPWHSIVEHQPIGAINRARRPVMKSLSDFRLERNEVVRTEPTVEELDALEKTKIDESRLS